MPLILEDINELYHIWMVDLLQDVDFLLEPNFVLLGHLFLAQHLHCISHSSSPVFRLLYCGETASAQGTLNLVGFLDVTIIRVALHFN